MSLYPGCRDLLPRTLKILQQPPFTDLMKQGRITGERRENNENDEGDEGEGAGGQGSDRYRLAR